MKHKQPRIIDKRYEKAIHKRNLSGQKHGEMFKLIRNQGSENVIYNEILVHIKKK